MFVALHIVATDVASDAHSLTDVWRAVDDDGCQSSSQTSLSACLVRILVNHETTLEEKQTVTCMRQVTLAREAFVSCCLSGLMV